MQETTSSQFVEWMEYLDQQMKTHQKMDYYLAQIAMEVRRTIMKHPGRTKIKEFLLKFTSQGVSPSPPKTEDELEQRMNKSKSFWRALIGLGRNK